MLFRVEISLIEFCEEKVLMIEAKSFKKLLKSIKVLL